MAPIYEDDYYSVDAHGDELYVLTRKPSAWPSLDVAREKTDEAIAALREALPASGRGRGIVMDYRAARSRNDEAFEATMSEYRDAVIEHFDKVAFVLRTVVGKLQMQRMNQGLDAEPALFNAPEEAMAWLREPT